MEHPIQMPHPPLLFLLKWRNSGYSKLLMGDILAPHLSSKGVPCHPVEETHFSCSIQVPVLNKNVMNKNS